MWTFLRLPFFIPTSPVPCTEMDVQKLLQFFLFLALFSLLLVFFWCLDAGESMLMLNSEHLQRNQHQLTSTYRRRCSTFERGQPTAAPSEGPEDFDATTRNQSDTTSTSTKWLSLQLRQYARKKLIQDRCSQNVFVKNATFDDVAYDQMGNLVVDDQHGIIYCYVPKVACTEWKSIMIFLSESLKENGVPYKIHSDIPKDLIHNNSVIYLNRSHRDLMKWKIQKYKKFLFVRNPFVRLISAYRDKFEKKNDYFYKLLAFPIMRKYGNIFPPTSAEEAHAAGIRPSFSDFIQYILDLPNGDEGRSFEEHWRQVYYLCHPCQIKYDFIGKMETMEEDAQHLLRILKVDHMVQFPPGNSNRTEESWIKDWFNDIHVEWKRRLYTIYEHDFQLFGYFFPEENEGKYS